MDVHTRTASRIRRAHIIHRLRACICIYTRTQAPIPAHENAHKCTHPWPLTANRESTPKLTLQRMYKFVPSVHCSRKSYHFYIHCIQADSFLICISINLFLSGLFSRIISTYKYINTYIYVDIDYTFKSHLWLSFHINLLLSWDLNFSIKLESICFFEIDGGRDRWLIT